MSDNKEKFIKLQAYLFINLHNFLLMFPGWSDYSICSYLLIVPVTIHDNQYMYIQLLHYCKTTLDCYLE